MERDSTCLCLNFVIHRVIEDSSLGYLYYIGNKPEADNRNRTGDWSLEGSDFTPKLYPQVVRVEGFASFYCIPCRGALLLASLSTHFLHTRESIRQDCYLVKSPQRGFAPATIAYKAIILTAKTMGAVKLL